jgi:hypothetical protein
MAIGKRKSGGDYLPMLKYDARVGQLYFQDRVYTNGSWASEQRDVTKGFRAAFDLENLQRGWIRFPKGAAPETKLVRIGQDQGDPPSDDFKEGIRLLVKMDTSLGGDVRELMSTAAALWFGLDALHDDYLAGAGAHPGALPVVDLDHVTETKTTSWASFTPTFKIVGWLPRPPDLPATEAARAAPKPKAAGDDMDKVLPF